MDEFGRNHKPTETKMTIWTFLCRRNFRLIPRSARVPSPTLRDLLAVVFRQRRLALISFVAVFLAVVLYGLIAPPYQSEMKVLVRRGRVDPVVTSTPSQAEFEREGVTEEEMNSEVELLHDDEILRTVVRRSGLISEGQSWFWSLFGDNEERQLARAVRRINKRLTVEAVRKATLITVSYKSSDPAQAANVLHSLAAAYLERHEQVHRPSGEFKFFDQQVVQSRSGLEEAELQLMRFGADQGVTSAALERDMALQKLSASGCGCSTNPGIDRRNLGACSRSGEKVGLVARADHHPDS